jgi:hypothetical protein
MSDRRHNRSNKFLSKKFECDIYTHQRLGGFITGTFGRVFKT